eukprot:GFKZ01010152.1.p1 GENE.GFKZ01010152.1~~GFKZ01010152.1.p1  ORF type:complete len:437 (+),score=106.51 GFKZ01010152.1:138-1448(+)
MAKVPREAVEFARMVVRAFYPPEFIVLTDAVLRHNNYCAHHDLARRLHLQPKELRQTLVRMVQERLMRNEKRQQKRINLRDERRQARLVNTEFWYVPLAEVVDAFIYRVHRATSEFEKKRQNELAAQKHVCERCGSEYQLLEILTEMTAEGDFVCTKMGVRPDRRPAPCGGIIREQDNSHKVKEMERIMHKLDEELRPLRTKAFQCAKMEIPAHPLEGADEETWGELVPETVGIHGEAVNEDGLDLDTARKMGDEKLPNIERVAKAPASKKDDDVVPEKPKWFQSDNKGDRDLEDDWDNDGGNVLDNKAGTAASFGEEDAQAYYERYLKEIAGEDVRANGKSSVPVIDLDGGESAQQDVKAKKETPERETKAEKVDVVDEVDELENVMVSVAGKQMKLSEVTEDMTDQMTAAEYKAYFALAQGGVGGEGDDDDEYE